MPEWWHNGTPNTITAYPWLHKDVVDYLESIIKPNFEVLEHGSGGSTLWLAERVKRVVAFENKPQWKEKIEGFHKENVAVVLSDGWSPSTVLLGGKVDLLIIDGEPVKDRNRWMADAHHVVKSGGWVMLDNANRANYKEGRAILNEHAELVKRFDCNEGNTEYLITEFYRMK